jgi:ring-1,2-phenylacetyl-CoA epoxidase subunit PaaC
VRLGDGTAESGARMQRALDDLWPYTAELFSLTPQDEAVSAAGCGVAWAELQPGWEAQVLPLLAQARLSVPAATPFLSRGKLGIHTEHFGHLLTELQHLQRAFPGGTW